MNEYAKQVERILQLRYGRVLDLIREAKFLRDSETAGLWPHVAAALIARYGSKAVCP